MYTHGWSQFCEDRLAILESFIGLEVQLDAFARAVVAHNEVLKRQIALVGRWMRHYRDIDVVGCIAKFAHHDVGLQHHDVLFKKESRLSADTVCLYARESVRQPRLRRPAGREGPGYVHTHVWRISITPKEAGRLPDPHIRQCLTLERLKILPFRKP